MEQQIPPSETQLKSLLNNIQNCTVHMSNTFQQAILKHEEQFIKTYRIKIGELTKLFDQLTQVLEDKFINNALTNRLNIIQQERDYFKYECLKLNVQYQTVVGEQTNLTTQLVNITDQMKIYKHLLEDEKLKVKELEKNAEKFKSNFNQMAYKTLAQTIDNVYPKNIGDQKTLDKKNKKLDLVLGELQDKNQQIRSLKIKNSQLQLIANERQAKYIQRKELYETFKACMDAWKRDILTKQRKLHTPTVDKKGIWNPQKISLACKKDLLRYFFTSSDFLKFVEQLLFDPNFKVEFTEVNPEGEKYMIENRAKLFEFMKKKKVICAPSLLER